MIMIPILLLSITPISGKEDNVCGNGSIELFTFSDIFKDRLLLQEKSFIEAIGPDAGAIRTAYLATDPLCRRKAIPLHKRARVREWDNLVEFDNEYPGKPFISPDENTIFFFCTSPPSAPFDHMVKISAAIDYTSFYYLVPIFMLMLFMSATFSGLNLAIMSFSIADLKLIIESDQEQLNRTRAANVLRLRKQSNFVLCTVVIGNCFCNTSITIIMNYFGNTLGVGHLFVTELVSTTLLLVFTEILPSLICTKNALKFASMMQNFVIFSMVLTLPISWPLSRLLDKLLGPEDSNEEPLNIETLEEFEATEYVESENFNMMNVVKRTLLLRQKRAEDVMTPIECVSMISDHQPVTQSFWKEIHGKGHSRLPVCEGRNKNKICGVLNLKDLLLLMDDEAGGVDTKLTAGTMLSVLEKRRKHCFVLNTLPVQQFMTELQEGCMMAIVIQFIGFKDDFDDPGDGYRVLGIITLEDSLEEIIGEIFDEKDREGLDGEKEEESLISY